MRHRQKISLMTIPYRVRRGLQRFFITAGVLALICIAAFGAWMLWLSRYVVYTDDGAKLDFFLTFDHAEGEIARPPEGGNNVSISYGNTDDLDNLPSETLNKLEGCTVTTDMLTSDHFAATKAALEALPEGSVVMLDIRNVRGEFYYTSSLGRAAGKVNTAAVDDLIRDLQDKNCYLIARFPAFRDRWYFLEDETGRVPYGLPVAGGNGSLWEDVSIKNLSHYWFNPASTGTLNYLVQIVTEVKNLGFDEVVFSDFRFPNTEKIKFSGDKSEALNSAAETLVQACATDSFAVSFSGSQITLPSSRCRLYLEDVSAADIPDLVASLNLETPETQLVFLTDLLDTRFTAYGVLRPLEISQVN